MQALDHIKEPAFIHEGRRDQSELGAGWVDFHKQDCRCTPWCRGSCGILTKQVMWLSMYKPRQLCLWLCGSLWSVSVSLSQFLFISISVCQSVRPPGLCLPCCLPALLSACPACPCTKPACLWSCPACLSVFILLACLRNSNAELLSLRTCQNKGFLFCGPLWLKSRFRSDVVPVSVSPCLSLCLSLLSVCVCLCLPMSVWLSVPVCLAVCLWVRLHPSVRPLSLEI